MPLLRHRPQLFLTLGDDGILVVPHHIPQATPFFVANDSRNGTAEIMAAVAQHPHAVVTFLVDHLAQDYRHDILPRLNWFDRNKLIHRRLKQNFPNAGLTASWRRRSARDHLTLIGLAENHPALTWCERLSARLPSIFLLPFEGARLIKILDTLHAQGWVMLVSRHKSGGFRQIVTHNGDFIFTRLTPLPPLHLPTPSREDLGDIIARDIRASLDYLNRHGLRHARDLTVHLLMPDDLHHLPSFSSLGLKNISSQSPFQTAEKLGLPFAPSPESDESDLLFTALLATHRPSLRLRPPALHSRWRTQFIQHHGLRITYFLLAMAILHCVIQAYDVAANIIESHHQKIILADIQQQVRATQATAAPVTEPLGRLRQAVERRRFFHQPTMMPWEILKRIQHHLSPEVSLTKIDWSPDNDNLSEKLSLALRVTAPQADADRADTVALFTQAVERLAQNLPEYHLTVIRTPYPDLAQDPVTTAAPNQAPIGEITLQRNKP